MKHLKTYFPLALSKPSRTRSTARAVVLALIAWLMLPPTTFAGDWWNGDWQFRKSITVQLPPAATGGASSVVIPVRLHAGNFGFFSDIQPNGADLRFISSDGNALSFQIELLDPVVGLLVAWVEVPVKAAGSEQTLFMYYGNPKAAAPDAAHLYDADQVLVLHFGESQGVPRDSTAYHYDAAASTAFLGTPGVIGNGARFDGHDAVRMAERPGLAVAENGSFTFSAWIQVDASSPRSVLYVQQQKDRRVEVGISGPKLYAEVADGKRINRVESANPLPASGWHHVAASIGNEIALYVDGTVAGSGASGGLPAVNGEVLIGGLDDSAGISGFKGQMDEVEISRIARSAWWAQVSAQTQSPDSAMIAYGKDESKGAAGKLAAYFAMMGNLLKQVSLDGLAVIVVTTVLGLASFGVLFTKASLLTRVESQDAKFLGVFQERLRGDVQAALAAKDPAQIEEFGASGLAAMYREGLKSLSAVLAAGASGGSHEFKLSSEALEAIRAALDGALVEATDQLNARLVLMTIAIAGAPFLGLLGTVVGVMITFASIAAAGDVNVNTIAPGVAAAMAATVVGLLVAIPSLFGYNWLATRIGRRTSAMEVFASQLLSNLSLLALASHQHPAAGRQPAERNIHAA